jgi:type IV pilus assembly protein PilX
MNDIHLPSRARQEGAALAVGLILLLVMTIVGVTSLRTVTLEEKMAGNTQNRNMALQAAEAALRNAEGWLDSRTLEPEEHPAGSTGVWRLDAPDPDGGNGEDWWDERGPAWWASDTVPYGGDPASCCSGGTDLVDQSTTPGAQPLAENPRFLIEKQAFVPDSLTLGNVGGPPTGALFYRITSRGVGGTDTAVSMLQTTYTRRY